MGGGPSGESLPPSHRGRPAQRGRMLLPLLLLLLPATSRGAILARTAPLRAAACFVGPRTLPPLALMDNAAGTPPHRQLAAAAAWTLLRPLRHRWPWAVVYADLRPYDETSPEAAAFLATNLVFFLLGTSLTVAGGAPELGALCDLAGAASIWYHYEQCVRGGTQHPAARAKALGCPEPSRFCELWKWLGA